jgi:6-pyruvoyltetrahydropterin/6-carboxytetrahydropterin synthase
MAAQPSLIWYHGLTGNSKMHVELKKSFQFEAAHSLPNLPTDHKCHRLHGHSFKVELTVSGVCDEKLGWMIDYDEIKKAFHPTWVKLDHRHLNEINGLENPTSENIAKWIWEEVSPKLPNLTAIEVSETCNASCTYRGE